MMRVHRFIVLACGLMLPLGSLAHEGHDHGVPPPLPAAQALGPRMEAASPEFELLASLEGGRLVVWLDRFGSNAPVRDATVEVESPALSGALAAQPDGSFAIAAGGLARPGRHALVFSIGGAAGADLLNGTLAVPEAVAAPSAAGGGLPRGLLAIAIALLAGIALWRALGRRRSS